jgi:hypothetical protein
LIAEVIESKTDQFVAETVKYHEIPGFGSFVRVQDGTRRIYGIVSGAYTGSIDGSGKARAFFKSIRELELEQPQVFSLLRTEFTAVVAGYLEAGIYRPYYPPVHVRLHLPVEMCDDEEVLKISTNTGFLIKTLNCPNGNGDELTAAALRTVAILHDNAKEYLLNAGRELLKMMAYDTQRLKSVFERVDIL